MHFGSVVRTGDIVFEAVELGMAFGSNELFKGLNFSLPRGKRLGIMGPNGSGKTTLLKIILDEIQPTSGEMRVGAHVDPGYLDQHLSILDEKKPVLRAVWPFPDPDIDEKKMRDLLGRFGLSGDIVNQPVSELSGGERSRACLARLVASGVNVLVLDEPTNHLDVWASEALEDALREYEGTVVVVSHDRYFLNRVVDLLIVLDGQRLQVIHGNYDTYELMRAAQSGGDREKSAKAKEESIASRAPAAAKPAKRKRKFPYRKVPDLEAEIAATESQVKQWEESLATPELYRDANKFREGMPAFEQGRLKLQELYEHWEEAVELNSR